MTKKPKLLTMLVAGAAVLWPIAKTASAHSSGFTVEAQVFDPAGTHLVAAEWERGIGCPPVGASISLDGTTLTPYNDPACATGDPSDKHNEGLLLVKTGPTGNFAAAGAVLHGVKGIVLSELGYDIRKPGASVADPRGSHCDGGAPRFNITIAGNIYFLACNSPAPNSDSPGNGWQRLRWGTSTELLAFPQISTQPCIVTPPSGACNIKGQAVDSIEIVFDEGDDTGPDNFGAAVLDNIDVNGVLAGRGAEEHDGKDEEKVKGDHGDSLTDDRPSHHHH
jgi:hypothetical protein